MDNNGIVERLVVEARRRLAEGTDPSQVFAQLAEGESNARDVALAVCVAIGVPRAEADQRLGSHDLADWNLDGDEQMSRGDYVSSLADILEAVGTFDLHVALSGDQRRIADLLAAAITEISVVRSGCALSYQLAVSRGRLHEAFVMLSRPERMGREVNTRTYWARLVEAAEMLGSDGDGEYVVAVQRCRDHLAQSR